jgi:hypothetical protein
MIPKFELTHRKYYVSEFPKELFDHNFSNQMVGTFMCKIEQDYDHTGSKTVNFWLLIPIKKEKKVKAWINDYIN